MRGYAKVELGKGRRVNRLPDYGPDYGPDYWPDYWPDEDSVSPESLLLNSSPHVKGNFFRLAGLIFQVPIFPAGAPR
jgi:hypothetical protein